MNLETLIKTHFPKLSRDGFEQIDLSLASSETALGLGGVESVKDPNVLVSWPPNVFLVLYYLLEYTDKYRLIVSPQNGCWTKADRDEGMALKNEWLDYLESRRTGNSTSAIPELTNALNIVFHKDNFEECIYDLCESHKFISTLYKLIISVDELFSDLDLTSEKSNNSFKFFVNARRVVFNNINNLANNDGKTGVVTYKYLVPQSGLTINNLTQHITFLKPSVKPHLTINKVKRKRFDKASYNVLFLPWPMEIESDSFSISKHKSNIETDNYFDFFDYAPTKEISEKKFILTIISALERVGFLDIIVLPECSVSLELLEKLKALLFDSFGTRAPALLAGTYGPDGEHCKNSASLSFIGASDQFDTIEQNKHHRWFLDGSQLTNYNLANALDPGKKWWENIKVGRRKLVSLHTGDNIRVCPLICEDLARQDPVAQAVRAVGPNLVISLLLDGPQIEKRWPGKYASVLSEDPGSSVLSVTALGMTLRSTGTGFPPSRQVALWSESGKKPETLEIKDDGAGIVIELKMKTQTMWSIDGRSKEKNILRKINDSTVFTKSSLNELNLESLKNILKGMVAKDEH
ncbi:hypothetical protein CRN32_06320 [Vibrio vulnificus]|uniref:hypothetical protein n=1 Tax=Vibrio vulnificus TaxID=672 RepID=UPI000CD07907|nr:hypothetical protein [Vibrio vulnificus]POC57362.1 hypothetical protein CRN32_06320 [Vibrio vulnificus]